MLSLPSFITLALNFRCPYILSLAPGQMAPPLAAFGAAKAAVLPILEIIQRKPLIDGFSEVRPQSN